MPNHEDSARHAFPDELPPGTFPPGLPEGDGRPSFGDGAEEQYERARDDEDSGYNWGPPPVDEESVPPEEHRHGAIIPQSQQWPHRM